MLGHIHTPTGPVQAENAPLAQARHAAAVAAAVRYRLTMLREACTPATGHHPRPPHLDQVRLLIAWVHRPVQGGSYPF